MPEQKCIGWPEQKYISDAGKKAPELGVPGMSKAVAFTKVYTDPANAALAQRERRQNQPRAA